MVLPLTRHHSSSNCGPERSRTADLRNANAALYQLSYRPIYLLYQNHSYTNNVAHGEVLQYDK